LAVKIEGMEEINAVFKKLDKDMQCDLLKELADQTFLAARDNVAKHSKTGKMEHNLRSDISCKNGNAVIGVDDAGMMVDWKGKKINYGMFVHFGTKPHKIFPKRALRWGDGGKFHFAKVVNHPGYKGDPFLYTALEEASQSTTKLFQRFMNEL